jgi:hypothetical protein
MLLKTMLSEAVGILATAGGTGCRWCEYGAGVDGVRTPGIRGALAVRRFKKCERRLRMPELRTCGSV